MMSMSGANASPTERSHQNMSNRFWWWRLCALAIVLTYGMLAGKPVAAQTRVPETQGNEASADTIKCWWRADKSAVEIGERFTVTLTCGVTEAPRARVVPKAEQFDPAAMQLAPFEVLDGTRQNDIVAPPWRYFQHEYTLRLIGQDFFGQDVDIPSLTLTYNIQSDAAGASEGRDQMYVLPALPIRILSLVPNNANDIRDSTRESFGEVRARLSRATGELIAAAILFAFSLLMLAAAVAHLIRKRRTALVRDPAVSAAAITRACLRELDRLKSEVAREGWTSQRAGSALTVLRIGSAVAMGRPVAQAPMDSATSAREGQLALRRGMLRGKRIAVSAPITSAIIGRYRASGNGYAHDRRIQTLIDQIDKSMQTFTSFRYGRNGHVDAATLSRVLENGHAALKGLHFASLWPMRAAAELARSARMARSSMWTR
jgi:hypothetical protein